LQGKPKEHIINNISSKNLEAIPLDLAKVFFDLNIKAMNIARVSIKKDIISELLPTSMNEMITNKKMIN
jgi:hypothetical protein